MITHVKSHCTKHTCQSLIARQTLTETNNGPSCMTQDTRGSGLAICLPVSLESVPENLCPLHAGQSHGVRTFTRRLAHEAYQQLYRSRQSWVWTLAARLTHRQAPTCAHVFTQTEPWVSIMAEETESLEKLRRNCTGKMSIPYGLVMRVRVTRSCQTGSLSTDSCLRHQPWHPCPHNQGLTPQPRHTPNSCK